MYQHVIVPFDGGLESRAALAPAADLAWRCGAKVVVVSTTAVEDEAATHALKSQAMSKSGADIDFWLDRNMELGAAVVEATRFRADSLICVASRYRLHGVIRKKKVPSPLPGAVLRHSPVPVLVIGPETDLTRGLPLGELLMPVDDSPESVRAARLAVQWANELRVALRFLYVVAPGAVDPNPPAAVGHLHDEVRAEVPGATLEVIETDHPAAALVAIAAEGTDAVILLPSTGATDRAALDRYAHEVVDSSTRAVLVAPPAV